jgi:cobaltochelatase CobS
LFGIPAPDQAVLEVGISSHAINENYIFDPLKVKKALMWIHGRRGYKNIGGIGDAGSGKTSFFQEFAARMGLDYDSISCSGDTRYEQLFGRRELVNGNTIYVETGLAARWRNGGVFCLGEMFRMDTGEAMRMVDLLDEDGRLTNPETGEIIPRHPLFRLCMTGNSGGFGDESGAFIGEKQHSLAIRDRFIMLHFKGMSEEKELEMLTKAVPDLAANPDIASRMVKIARLVRSNFVGNGGGLSVDISHRGLERWGHTLAGYTAMSGIDSPFLESLQDSILNGAPQTTVDTILELIKEWM